MVPPRDPGAHCAGPLRWHHDGRGLTEGVLFTTYATLRSEERGAKKSRVDQIVDWLGADFDGVILLDERHAIANAAGSKCERGDTEASQQGRAGLRLQHKLPNARVVYVSATGATSVHNLACAQRLGLWGGEDFPFATRSEFVEAIEAGGVAAMEVLARDLRSLGLYTARSLSGDGVEYEMLEHALTPEQRGIYDAYRRCLDVNLTGAILAVQGELPMMKAARRGCILFTGSTSGIFGTPYRAPYVVSKWAINGLMKTVAMEAGPFGIRANVIAPACVEGPRMDGVIAREAAAKGTTPRAVRNAYLEGTSLRCFARPNEVAAMALFLASDSGSRVSGQVMVIDGHTENPDPKV